MSTDWFRNDELFLRELREGHRQAELVATMIRARGLAAAVTPMEVRQGVENRQDFADEFDLTVGTRRPCPIDVKSRALGFSGPQDYPYDTALVDTAAGWEQKSKKPLAIVLVSQRTRGVAVVRVSGAERWHRVVRFDNIRKISDTFLEVDRCELATFDEFVAWLETRETAA